MNPDLSPERPQFVCPGQLQPVSAAVHRARLSSGWSVCDECDWRLHTEGLSERSAAQALSIRQHRVTGIERTEFGVRGLWLNALTPAAVRTLAQILCLSLVNSRQLQRESAVQLAADRTAGSAATALPVEWAAAPELLMGFDSRGFSAEVFAAVVTAIRELGVDVLDAGRSTSASLQEVLRCYPRLAGALFVTGAGAAAGWSGLDATDVAGDGVQVVWRDFGVVLRSAAADSGQLPAAAAPMRLSLELPESGTGGRPLRRFSRTLGRYETLDFEPRYREWLRGWHRGTSMQRLLVGADDVLVQQRVQWLAENCGWTVAACSLAEARRAGSGPALEVHDNDRWLVLRRAGGERVDAGLLAARLNSATAAAARSSQLTAHADSVTGRLWFTDSARPGTVGLTERIEDALAVVAMLLGADAVLAELEPGNFQRNRSSTRPPAC